eukprot:PLAT8187.1.p1 GENE.PLAT8187.1~~PLAT8187.1.p1  ORF type:complete len:181 (+),score=26.61 PLAT8187.1:20-562(+)
MSDDGAKLSRILDAWRTAETRSSLSAAAAGAAARAVDNGGALLPRPGGSGGSSGWGDLAAALEDSTDGVSAEAEASRLTFSREWEDSLAEVKVEPKAKMNPMLATLLESWDAADASSASRRSKKVAKDSAKKRGRPQSKRARLKAAKRAMQAEDRDAVVGKRLAGKERRRRRRIKARQRY